MPEAKSPVRMIAVACAIALVCALALGLAVPAEQAHAASATTTTVKVGAKSFKLKLASGEPAAAFRAYLSKSRTLKMAELNGNEKYRYLNRTFPTAEKRYKEVRAGDVMLYGDDCLVIFYKTHKTSYRYTKIGRLASAKGLAKAAGKKGAKVRFGKMEQATETRAPSQGSSAGSAAAAASPAAEGPPATETPDKSESPAAPEATITQPAAGGMPTDEAPAGDEAGLPGDSGSPATPQPEPGREPGAPAEKAVRLSVGDQTAAVALADTEAARAFAALMEDGPLTVETRAYGGFEQVGALSSPLPASDERMTTAPGDIALYQGNQICLFHGSSTWSYTPLGRIEGWTDEQLRQLLGTGNTTLVFSLA